jgi:hypothetical protein
MVVVGEPQSAAHAALPEKLAAESWCDVVAVSANNDVRHVSVTTDQSRSSDRPAS